MLASEQLKAGAYTNALKFIAAARDWPEHLGTGKPYPEDCDERLEDWLAYQCHHRLDSAQARQYLQRITNVSPPGGRRNTGEVVRALALREAGKETEGRQLLEQWSREEPSSELAKWAESLFSSAPAALPPSLQSTECRVLAASLQ